MQRSCHRKYFETVTKLILGWGLGKVEILSFINQ